MKKLQLEQLQQLRMKLHHKLSQLQGQSQLKPQRHQRQCNKSAFFIFFLNLNLLCLSTTIAITTEASTTSTIQETTTDQPTTIPETTESDIPEHYEGKVKLYCTFMLFFLSGAIPLWVILLISFCIVLITFLVISVFLTKFYPEVWKSLKRKLPQCWNRRNQYQVTPLYSCRLKYCLLTRCLLICPEFLKCKWLLSRKPEPSRDTCFLCMKKVFSIL